MPRPDWYTYYLDIAEAVSARGECRRRKVGAVIVKDYTIISTGYNGAPPGQASCLDGGCPRAYTMSEPGTGYAATGCTVIHAEANAVIRAGRDRCVGSTIYITAEPCDLCLPLLQAAGLEHAVFPDPLGEAKFRVLNLEPMPAVIPLG